MLVVSKARHAHSPHEGSLHQDPEQVEAVPDLPEEAVAPPPPRLPAQPHEAGPICAQVASPQQVHNAAALHPDGQSGNRK